MQSYQSRKNVWFLKKHRGDPAGHPTTRGLASFVGLFFCTVTVHYILGSMDDAVLLTMITAAAAGFVAVFTSVTLERSRRTGFFRYFSLQILLFNLLILTGLIWEYAGMNGAQTGQEAWSGPIPLYLLPLMSILKLSWLFSFVVMNRLLLNETVSKKFVGSFAAAAGLLFLIHLIAFFYRAVSASGLMLLISVAVVEWPVVVTAYVTLIYVLLESRKAAPGDKKSIRLLGAVYLFTLTVMIVSLAAGQPASPGRMKILRLVNSVDMVFYNLLPVFWCVWYGRTAAGERAPRALRKVPADELMGRYNITRREREIVALACAGKTNQEIADVLYISLQTVKDHLRSVFRKSKVRNRVELCNLFGSSGENEIETN